MSESELDEQERIIPELAVKALIAAQRRARASGRPVVLIADGKLIRSTPHGNTVLRIMPPQEVVSERTKRAKG